MQCPSAEGSDGKRRSPVACDVTIPVPEKSPDALGRHNVTTSPAGSRCAPIKGALNRLERISLHFFKHVKIDDFSLHVLRTCKKCLHVQDRATSAPRTSAAPARSAPPTATGRPPPPLPRRRTPAAACAPRRAGSSSAAPTPPRAR